MNAFAPPVEKEVARPWTTTNAGVAKDNNSASNGQLVKCRNLIILKGSEDMNPCSPASLPVFCPPSPNHVHFHIA
jgi:hypothetical protein